MKVLYYSGLVNLTIDNVEKTLQHFLNSLKTRLVSIEIVEDKVLFKPQDSEYYIQIEDEYLENREIYYINISPNEISQNLIILDVSEDIGCDIYLNDATKEIFAHTFKLNLLIKEIKQELYNIYALIELDRLTETFNISEHILYCVKTSCDSTLVPKDEIFKERLLEIISNFNFTNIFKMNEEEILQKLLNEGFVSSPDTDDFIKLSQYKEFDIK